MHLALLLVTGDFGLEDLDLLALHLQDPLMLVTGHSGLQVHLFKILLDQGFLVLRFFRNFRYRSVRPWEGRYIVQDLLAEG